MSEPERPRPDISLTVAAFLTWISGFVDAVGYLTFARVYTANMSGNSVALGISLNQRHWWIALFRFWPILLYVIGLIAGRTLIQIGARKKVRCIASAAFLCEATLLAVVSFSGGIAPALPQTEWQYSGVALLSFAMGIQNAALTRFSSLTLHSGFVTGTLVQFAEQFVGYATWLWDNLRLRKSAIQTVVFSFQESSFRLSLFLAMTWIAYVIGAVAGTWGKAFAGNRSLRVAIAALLLLIVVDLRKPLAIQEETKQARLP